MTKQLLILTFFIVTVCHAQEKKLWAKSFLNQSAPEFIVQKWLTDTPDTRGKFVLIDFWATWCGPCKKAIPELNHYQEMFKEHLVVIGISDEPKSTVKRMKKPTINYFSAIDTKARLKNAYEVKGIPHCVLINPEGMVVWEGWPHLAGHELTEEVIAELIIDKTVK